MNRTKMAFGGFLSSADEKQEALKLNLNEDLKFDNNIGSKK
jgi:hypothetical protein